MKLSMEEKIVALQSYGDRNSMAKHDVYKDELTRAISNEIGSEGDTNSRCLAAYLREELEEIIKKRIQRKK